jgi:hypothetical protein
MREIEKVKPKSAKSVIRLLNFYNPNERNKEIPDPWAVSCCFFVKKVSFFTKCFFLKRKVMQFLKKYTKVAMMPVKAF